MGFLLKKFVSFWLMPLPFCLALLTLGLALGLSERRRKLGHGLLGLAVLLLFLFSNRAVSTALIRPLERNYPAVPELTSGRLLPPPLDTCRFVVVLGGGHGDTPGFAALHQLSSSSRARLTEGVRILRALPDAKLVVSGRGAPGKPTHAEVLAQAAQSLGVDASRIVRLDSPRDTHDEAIALAQLVQRRPVALVTSAWHQRRALALMKTAGVNAHPAPCDYLARSGSEPAWTDFAFDSDSLSRSTRAVSERLGYLWSRLRGQID